MCTDTSSLSKVVVESTMVMDDFSGFHHSAQHILTQSQQSESQPSL